MSIRIGQKSDRLQIQALMEELNVYRSKIFNPDNQEFHKRIQAYSPLVDEDFERTFIFVATEDSGIIVGFIQGRIDQRPQHSLYALGCIDELYVQEHYRGKGFAAGLYEELVSVFKEKGCDHLITHTDAENELSQKFYKQNGMSVATLELWKKL